MRFNCVWLVCHLLMGYLVRILIRVGMSGVPQADVGRWDDLASGSAAANLLFNLDGIPRRRGPHDP